MAREYPQGAVCHVGAQLRYLLVSEHGLLGALGFAASALALASRDAFIGWDAELRSRQLQRVVALSRFLIRPSVCCQNLASKALGLALRRLPGDFEGRCAAPATRVGVKAVWLYPLARDWRAPLGVAPPAPPQALGPGEGLARQQWAGHEFGGAPLGDARLSKRLVRSVEILSEQPMSSFPGVAGGDRAAVKGYYRLIGQPADSEVTPESILAPRRERTLRRMQGQETVLCIRDGTDLNFAEHGACRGLGYIGRNSGAQGTLGLHMHSTLAVNGEGIPLGVPHIQYEAPDGQAEQGKPLGERKTMRWIRGLRACADMAAELEGVRPVSVMDREADVFALFAEQRRLGSVDLLARAKNNRSLGKGLPKRSEGVRAEAAHRVLAPGAEDGLQGGMPGAPDGGADRAGGDDQRGDRVAADGDDADGSGHAGAAAGDAVFRHRDRRAAGLRDRPQAGAAGQSRAGGADDGDSGRVPELQAQAVRCTGSPDPVGRLHAARHHRASLRTRPALGAGR